MQKYIQRALDDKRLKNIRTLGLEAVAERKYGKLVMRQSQKDEIY